MHTFYAVTIDDGDEYFFLRGADSSNSEPCSTPNINDYIAGIEYRKCRVLMTRVDNQLMADIVAGELLYARLYVYQLIVISRCRPCIHQQYYSLLTAHFHATPLS